MHWINRLISKHFFLQDWLTILPLEFLFFSKLHQFLKKQSKTKIKILFFRLVNRAHSNLMRLLILYPNINTLNSQLLQGIFSVPCLLFHRLKHLFSNLPTLYYVSMEHSTNSSLHIYWGSHSHSTTECSILSQL